MYAHTYRWRRDNARRPLHASDNPGVQNYVRATRTADDENIEIFPRDTRTRMTRKTKRDFETDTETERFEKVVTEKRIIPRNVIHGDWSYHTRARCTVRTTIRNFFVRRGRKNYAPPPSSFPLSPLIGHNTDCWIQW